VLLVAFVELAIPR